MAELTRPEAVTLAVYALGGADEAIDTEDVAIRVDAIAPGVFVWQKYRDRIDKELVRVALSDARLKKKWVVGSHDKGGWLLTAAGQEFARRNQGRLGKGAQQPRRGKNDKAQARERARLLQSDACKHLENGGVIDGVSADEADAFFRLNVYVRGQARHRKIARIENQFADDPDLGDIVRQLADRARERS